MNASVLRATLLVVVAAAAVLFYACTFVVSQTQSALVLRLGAVRSVVTAPGLYFKLPAPFDQVTTLDNRILDLDLPAQEIIASDQKRLVVDAFTRYRISDPLRFYQAVNNIPRANSQLASIVNGNVRTVLAEASFIAMVRTERSRLMNRIRDDVNREAARFGMSVVDVRLRRVDLPAANSAAVFQRMQTERQREAAEARALGGQQAQEIKARAERDSTVIVAEAQQRSDEIRGEGEGERNKIFAEAFGKDPDFFAFYRSMQAYEASIRAGDTRMVLTPDSPFFRFFNGPNPPRQDGQGAAAAPAAPAPARP
ncbi:protease modulator HflC [Bosea sp. (in: a-proteobacteria)]|uniref:protease modulator HflC n=1 Tax=Bosea sp. (in: a-proteobacteria) TaxID=1871050 RepID=UPI002626D78D|nr:protease modulator HflC [Bosea sp. (in: a-proteobacteria)]MCO5091938.1 protease modulator HflC [Bosea sp. (in: a-proteobacteria)]